MKQQLDLFSQPMLAPPVSKPVTPREQANRKINKQGLRVMVLKALYERSWNADALADRVGQHFLSIRPRFTELSKAGLIYQSGTGKSALGNSQDIFTVRPQVQIKLQMLSIKFGIEKAAVEVLAQFGL